MVNQQVDDALNEYFSDLLGDTPNLANIDAAIAEQQTEQNTVKSILHNESQDLEKSDNTSSARELIENAPAAIIEQIAETKFEATEVTSTAKLEPLEAQNEEKNEQQSEPRSKKKIDTFPAQESTADRLTSRLDKELTPDESINVDEEQVPTLVKIDVLSDHLLSVKASLESHSVVDVDTETKSNNENKERLERMLKQVATLTATPARGVDNKAAIKTAASVKADITSDTETSNQKPKQASKVSQDDISLQDKPALETNTDFLAVPILGSQWNENGRPEWAQERFDILLLEIDGLQLAVPLVALGQIHEIDEEITPLFGQSDWFMGLQKTSDGNVKVVNTAKFIMPERYKGQHNYKYVISINGLGWGLAVDGIKQPITIDPEAIRWRSKRDSRPWMAGTVKDHMCVLLDIPKVGEILQTQDKNRVK
jgi:purine-binding chemotaxis protein CheW